jgi:DNA-binding HxlR family transcriptional regulator
MKVTTNRTVIDPLMPEHGYCPVEATIELIGGRWKAMILWALINRSPQRFTLLRQAGRGISQKMLAQQLRHLERHGLVTRTVFAEVPPRVEYAITPLGQTLRPVLEAMGRWGTADGLRPVSLEPERAQKRRLARCRRAGIGSALLTPPNNRFQRPALRAAAEPGSWADKTNSLSRRRG